MEIVAAAGAISAASGLWYLLTRKKTAPPIDDQQQFNVSDYDAQIIPRLPIVPEGVNKLAELRWTVKFSQEFLSGNAVWNGRCVAFHGGFGKGKTTIMNLLTEKSFPTANLPNTQGLSFLFGYKAKNADGSRTANPFDHVLLVDVAGKDAPIFSTKLEKVEGVDENNPEALKETVEERQHIEKLLQSFCLSVADFHLFVVNYMTASEQASIKQLLVPSVNANNLQCKFFVIHNLKETTELQELFEYRQMILDLYNSSTSGALPVRPENEQNDLVLTEEGYLQSRNATCFHIFLVKHADDFPECVKWNNLMIQLLKSWIVNMKVYHKTTNPIVKLATELKNLLPRFVKNVDYAHMAFENVATKERVTIEECCKNTAHFDAADRIGRHVALVIPGLEEGSLSVAPDPTIGSNSQVRVPYQRREIKKKIGDTMKDVIEFKFVAPHSNYKLKGGFEVVNRSLEKVNIKISGRLGANLFSETIKERKNAPVVNAGGNDDAASKPEAVFMGTFISGEFEESIEIPANYYNDVDGTSIEALTEDYCFTLTFVKQEIPVFLQA